MKKAAKDRKGDTAKGTAAESVAGEGAAAKRAAVKGVAARRGRAKKESGPTPEERRRVVAELRAFAHPLRLRLFELFVEKPRTTMQVAEILGEPPTRLYHHVNALQKSGLLRLRETKPIRGTVEKYFEAVVPQQHETAADVLRTSAVARQSARGAAGALLEHVRQDLNAEFADLPHGTPGPMMLRMLLTATPARAASVAKRLFTLLKELKAECGEGEGREATPAGAHMRELRKDEERWALTIAFMRSWPRRRGGSED